MIIETAPAQVTNKCRTAEKASKRKKCLGGQRKSLKRLKTDKRIQGNPSFFLWFSLDWLGGALLDLAKFGFGLA